MGGASRDGTTVALAGIRIFTYAMLAYAGFYMAMFIGKWYEATILADDELKIVLDSADTDGDGRENLYISHSMTSRFVFIGLPFLFAAALGGVYEALWKKQEIKSVASGGAAGAAAEEILDNRPGIFATIKNAIHYQYRPLGQYSPWLSVGETTVLFLWAIAMGSQCWQGVMNHGNHFHDFNIPCVDDPSSWCNMYTGEGSPTPNQYRFRMIGIFMGIVCTSHFAVILVPVSRDSKIWSAVGIPFERSVLYHAIAGHLAFGSLFLHAFLMTAHWINYKGWQHAVDMSIHFDPDTHGGVDTPAGWMAALCAIPMWVTSINWVRRKYYSLFKLAHWLFIGVFVFSMMHYAPNGLYFIGGLTLYTVHVFSRLESWKRWRYWNRWFSSDPAKASPTSLVSAVTNADYTRLVLRNPKGGRKASGDFSARGGSFVYISTPAALGTDEAHAITVALRGAPPSFSSVEKKMAPGSGSAAAAAAAAANLNSTEHENDVFTVYVKDLGKWTKALRSAARGAEATGDPSLLLVDVDGFYTQVQSLNSMKMAEGSQRVVIVAGGSGMTSLMGFIQDWCVAASEGADVPEVHLAWCCRYMSEFELVGEALPSLLAIAGAKKDTHFSMSLYCSKPDSSDGALSVTWPLDSTAYANSSTEKNVIGTNYMAMGLNHGARVLLTGLACFAGYILGHYEVDRRDLMNVFHEGAIIFVLQIICMISTLVIYDGIAGLIRKHSAESSAGTSPRVRGNASKEESKMDLEATKVVAGADSSVTYQVNRGRVPTEALLVQEAETAKKSGASRVKVLTSGPNSLVDKVLADSRAIDWQLFDPEAFSFEF